MSTTVQDDSEIHVIAEVVTTNDETQKDATDAELPRPPNSGARIAVHDGEDTDSDSTDGTYARIVVVGMDGSAQSYHAFHWYISNMHMDGNFVVLVHAFELPLLHSFQEMYVSPDMWQATLKREARSTENMQKRLRGVLNRCKIPGRFEARGGKPGEVLVHVAEETGADVVIVGTRGHGKLRRAVLGSVSDYVTQNAPCPVMVCRQKGRIRTDSAGSHASLGSIGARRRQDSTGSTGSRGSSSSRVRFDLCEKDEPKRRQRHHSTGSADVKSEKRKNPNLFKSILSRRRNKSESYCDTPSSLKDGATAEPEHSALVGSEDMKRSGSE